MELIRNKNFGLEQASDLTLICKLFNTNFDSISKDENLHKKKTFYFIIKLFVILAFYSLIFFYPHLIEISSKQFIFTVSIIGSLLTGLNVFFSKEKIEMFDKEILSFSNRFSEYLKYSLLEKFLISSKSVREIKYRYIFWGNIQMVIISYTFFFIFTQIDYYKTKFFIFFSEHIILDYFISIPSNYLRNDFQSLLFLTLGWILYFVIIPTSSLKKELNNKKQLQGIYKVTNSILVIFTISKFINYYIGLKSGLKGGNIISFFKEADASLYVLYIILSLSYIQCAIVLYLHMKGTINGITNNNSKGYWLFEIFFLLPYFIYSYVFLFFIPLIIALLFFKLINFFLKTSIYTFKIPSGLRLIGFIITLLITIFNFLKN